MNFEEQIELKSIFRNFDVDRILDELSIIFSTTISPGRTLIFLDEIQACPEALVALRYFYEKHPRLHVIAAGDCVANRVHAGHQGAAGNPVEELKYE